MSTQTSQPQFDPETAYEEHEKTYNLFLTLAKYGTLHVVALLIAMAFGFFTAAGFVTAFIIFVLISALGYYLLR